MDELQKQDKIAARALVNVAGTPVSVAARAGAPKPDISTVDAFKQTLLNARSIVYADPARGGASGVYFARVLDRLGIAEQMKAKTILVPGRKQPKSYAKVEVGVMQASEIVPVAGAQLVGPLPGEFASMTVFTAGIGAGRIRPRNSSSSSQDRKLQGPLRPRASSQDDATSLRGSKMRDGGAALG